MSPALPPETAKLENGTTPLVVESHSTTHGQYGDQEELVCLNENTGVHSRIWIPHNSRQKILQAIDCGIAHLNGEEWEVLDGVRFQAVVAGGKVVALLTAKTQ